MLNCCINNNTNRNTSSIKSDRVSHYVRTAGMRSKHRFAHSSSLHYACFQGPWCKHHARAPPGGTPTIVCSSTRGCARATEYQYPNHYQYHTSINKYFILRDLVVLVLVVILLLALVLLIIDTKII